MDRTVVVAVLTALVTGLAIGTQGAVVRTAQDTVGAARAGLLVNVAGGTLSLMALAAIVVVGGHMRWGALARSAPYWGAAGALGVGILIGIAFALPRLGLAAGLGGIILGQLLAAVVVDTAGLGAARIPLTGARLAGLALMAAGILLILPRR